MAIRNQDVTRFVVRLSDVGSSSTTTAVDATKLRDHRLSEDGDGA